MLEIIEDGIFLPEINNEFNWYLKNFESKTKLITYLDKEDIEVGEIYHERPWRTAPKHAAVWSTTKPGTIKDYLFTLEGIGSLAVMSLDHVFWLTENRHNLLNTTEKNPKGDYIGNFFFVPKNEFQIKDNIWTGDISVAAVIRRNTEDLQFGIRFYPIECPKIFEAKDRRIISLM